MIQHILGFLGGILWIERHEDGPNLGNRKVAKRNSAQFGKTKRCGRLATPSLKTIGDPIDCAGNLAVTPALSLKISANLSILLRL